MDKRTKKNIKKIQKFLKQKKTIKEDGTNNYSPIPKQ